MKISEKGLAMLKKFEGCKLTAYWDVNGYSIGYGHHSADIKKGDKITKEKAEEFLRLDLAKFERAVESYNTKYHFTQNEFDALVDFTYNCGVGNLRNLTKNGTRTKAQIKAYLPQYNKAGGKVNAGLVKRRNAELVLFIG